MGLWSHTQSIVYFYEKAKGKKTTSSESIFYQLTHESTVDRLFEYDVDDWAYLK